MLTKGDNEFYHDERDTRIEAEVLQAQDPSPASDQPLRYATDLAIYLAKKFYPDVTQWRPLDDLVGVLTQIDNMVAGVAVERDALQAKVAEQSAEIERLKREDFGPERIANHSLKLANSVLTEQVAQQAERIAEQAALIEKCEKALLRHQELTRPIQSTDEALAAITTYKGTPK